MEEKEKNNLVPDPVKTPFYYATWFAVLLFIFFPPMGVVVIWVNPQFSKSPRVLLTLVVGCWAILWLILLSGLTQTSTQVAPKNEVVIEKHLDQRLTGNWMLSADGYSGNDSFEYMTITLGEDGEYAAEAKISGTKEIVPINGKYAVDKNGNMYITKDSGAEIKYYYTLQDGSMLLQFMENGTVKLKRVEPVAQQPVVTEQPIQATSMSIDLSAGNYTVGTDLPSGKYDVTAISGKGNFFGKPGIVNEIMGVDDVNYIQTYKNATFINGNTIEVRGTLIVNLISK